jgi:hypothetical protein
MVPDIFSYNAVLYGYASSTHVKAPERAEKKSQDNCNVYLITTLQLTKSSCQNGEQKKKTI